MTINLDLGSINLLRLHVRCRLLVLHLDRSAVALFFVLGNLGDCWVWHRLHISESHVRVVVIRVEGCSAAHLGRVVKEERVASAREHFGLVTGKGVGAIASRDRLSAAIVS